MTGQGKDLADMMAEAERLGKELQDLDERNKKRRSKGRKPLMDPQEKKDLEVRRRRYRTSDATTVDGADALKLFELRKADLSNDDIGDDDDEVQDDPDPIPVRKSARAPQTQSSDDEDRARREAEAARRVQDMKNGRIDHEGNWSEEGQKLEGGDSTKLVDASEVSRAWGIAPAEGQEKSAPQPQTSQPAVGPESMEAFKRDLYARLGTSFQAIERTLSDLQGRVAEIITASRPSEPQPAKITKLESEFAQFHSMMEQRTPVTFDVGGAKMMFDAICVFNAPPCITVVSKIGSAKIMPKPASSLLLSYEMDGHLYENDPVTFLGTRFDLPMFGLSFVGFIRDAEADMMDVGTAEEA